MDETNVTMRDLYDFADVIDEKLENLQEQINELKVFLVSERILPQ